MANLLNATFADRPPKDKSVYWNTLYGHEVTFKSIWNIWKLDRFEFALENDHPCLAAVEGSEGKMHPSLEDRQEVPLSGGQAGGPTL